MDPPSKKQKFEEAAPFAYNNEIDALRRALREKETELLEKSNLVSALQTEAENREALVVKLKNQVAEKQDMVAILQKDLAAAHGVINAAAPSQPDEPNGTNGEQRVLQENVQTLPTELWAQVLEYSFYDDVARMARVSTSFLHQVMPLIRTLYITSQEAISNATSSRFRRGQLDEIILDCVFRSLETIRLDRWSDRYHSTFITCEWAENGALAMFLSALTSAKTIFLGKGERETKSAILQRLGLQENSTREGSRSYILVDTFAEDQANSFREGVNGYYARGYGDIFPSNPQTYAAMIRSLCNAYKSGSIPQSMQIYGLPAVHDGWEDERCVYGDCDLCKLMCNTFPLEQVVSLKSTAVKCYFPNKLGNNLSEKVLILHSRPNAEAVIMAKQGELFRDLLQQCELQILDHEGGDAIAITYGEHRVLQALRNLKSVGYDPITVGDANAIVTSACKRALKGVSLCHDYSDRFPFQYDEPILIMEDDYKALVNDIGVQLNEHDFKVMSETDPWPLYDG